MKRFPFFRQLDANDCGPTCIRMICAYYHNECSIEKLRELCHITRVGITIRDLTDALTQLGFKNFVVKIRSEGYANAYSIYTLLATKTFCRFV